MKTQLRIMAILMGALVSGAAISRQYATGKIDNDR